MVQGGKVKRRPSSGKIILGILVLAGLFAFTLGRAQADSRLRAASVEMAGLPPLTAPGAGIPLHWIVQGGAWVENTCVFWDTSSHAYDNNYRFRTSLQKGRPVGHFFDNIDVPEGTSTIYLKPFAVVDGEIIWGPREYRVPTARAINVGSSVAGYDTAGNWWDGDSDFVHHWYGFTGGSSRTTDLPIGNTEDDWIYRSQRVGVESFGCWLTPGVLWMDIEVEFHFAELDATASGQRRFSITLEPGTSNEISISNIDVYDQTGTAQALVITRTVRVQDYQLDITFSGSDAILNGLRLRGLQGVPQREAMQRIAFSNDDTYVVATANHRTDDTLLLGGNAQYHGGLRFFHIQVPQGATINHAELRVTAAEDSYQDMRLRIYGHAVDDSADFSYPPLVTERTRTSASVTWHVPRSEGWRAGREYTSPELKEVIQEVVNREGWRELNALSLLLIAENGDSAPRSIWAIDGNYERRAWLIIDYTPKESWEPTPAPTFTFTPIPTHTPTPTRTPTPTITPTPSPTFTPTPFELYLPLLFKPVLKT